MTHAQAQCFRMDPHLTHTFKVTHSALQSTVTFTCPGVRLTPARDATPLERVTAALAEYKGHKLSLRIFVDGVDDSTSVSPDGSRPLIYAAVKTSDLVSFLKRECSEVHPS